MTRQLRSIEVTCGKCGHVYVATGDMILSGLWRRACPVCYPPAPPAETPAAAESEAA